MSSSSLKFNIATLRSLSALASCPDDSSRSNNEYNEGAPRGICDLYEILEAVNSIPGVHEPTNTEASLVLDLARAKRDVFLAQKELADCVIRENEVFASLLRVRAAAAEKMIDQTDIGLVLQSLREPPATRPALCHPARQQHDNRAFRP
ncbi:uncharacterized protein F5891DRAFT_1198197 [Suillus fuscotomentosus]|uniref:Uncharacterized protein n=1 Tax=Suillus fuscotomentosus TaxID=1912939 RepID=A0AAD4DQU5_9AGAM|nr:uncharacterized protein F5891DRAFT_1198197 [Suillus fuscotomentosus]KAG1890444.1 hypothetical protein F5891DRAFT_1198197 [Suillus fuscotomentosus]